MEGQRRIVLALDRPIPYWEAVGMPRTIDYDLTIVVLDLDEKDEEKDAWPSASTPLTNG